MSATVNRKHWSDCRFYEVLARPFVSPMDTAGRSLPICHGFGLLDFSRMVDDDVMITDVYHLSVGSDVRKLFCFCNSMYHGEIRVVPHYWKYELV